MNQKIKAIIIKTLEELNEELQDESLNNPTNQTKLFGSNSPLDSMALVSFITDLEEKISEEFNEDVILADEKAMSQNTSPFRSVETLTLYIEKLLSK